ncbi:MAG: RnfABCDGE type electron transport complex subunit G [Prevotellaceae bacterium]|jgi:electron transport complex protein RnfG|nr:RnfABCDGE type electron transport complex subunit G [Prevotellaceae bacterium]
MEKLKSSFKNMLLSLALISIVVACLLAVVYKMTEEPIKQAEKQRKENAIKEVVPDFNNNPAEEKFEVEISDGSKLTVFPAKYDNKLVGIAVETNTLKGFSGEIRIMAGFDVDGTIKNYYVLKHAETPGLGAKMQKWFSDPSKPDQNVINRKWNNNINVKKDGGDIDAITAATITSRAFVDALNRAYEAYLKVIQNDSEKQESAK